MLNKIRRFFIGKPLSNESGEGEKFGALWGFPILASDAVSSVAYAGQEMLLVLLPVIGAAAFGQLTLLSGAIILLLLVLVASYRQTIEMYPNGGGAYVVAKENLGLYAGVTVGAALSVDYIMTVAVSVSSGVEQIITAFPQFGGYAVPICVVLVLLLMLGNLRGIKESARIFGLPTYLFIGCMLILICGGGLAIIRGRVPEPAQLASMGNDISLLLLLRAFSSGCAAVTGIEAVSDAVPNFKHPPVKRAKRVLTMLAATIVVLFGGISVIAWKFGVVPSGENALLISLAGAIFGKGVFYYVLTVITFLMLILAANTSFSGFPTLISVVASDGYAPRQLRTKGARLSYDNGIITLSVAAILLIAAFRARVSSLIGLYAVGVFLSFTLAQMGLTRKLFKERPRRWLPRMLLTSFGSLVTGAVVLIVGITKFTLGTWMVMVVIPLLIFAMLKVHHHYESIRKQLKIPLEEYGDKELCRKTYRNRVIVPIASINRSSVRALRYAATISGSVQAFSVAISEEEKAELERRWEMLDTDVPLKVLYSPYRETVHPLLAFIKSSEYDMQENDIVTVVLPQFMVKKRWEKLLHNHTGSIIEKELMSHRNIVIASIPLQLDE